MGIPPLIVNTEDPSGVIQPRLVRNAGQNLQVTAGRYLYWGEPDTEFGGIDIPGLRLAEAPADRAYLWTSWFF